MRIFLDANILFSAARADGAVRELLQLLQSRGHALLADSYVVAESERNLSAKEPAQALHDLRTLLQIVEVATHQPRGAQLDLSWLASKDQPVLMAAMQLKCDVLVTGDKTHFGPAYGKVWGGVTVLSPAMLARMI